MLGLEKCGVGKREEKMPKGIWLGALALLLGACAPLASPPPLSSAASLSAPASRLSLAPCRIPIPPEEPGGAVREEEARCGTFQVPENRATGSGRVLPLRVVILPARSPTAGMPVFFLSGGPGQAATESAAGFAGDWERAEREVVLMDLRGTGEGHRLDCDFGGSDEDPQSYLQPLFYEGGRFSSCRDDLATRADLTQYTTAIAMQDLDELRQALGYDKIILEGGSAGTRAALTYLRMFPGRVHAALLLSLSPIENRAPLYHAAAAQRAFDLLVRECQVEAPCNAAYPTVAEDLRMVLDRLRRAPAPVRVPHPATGVPIDLSLSAPAFADGLRVLLYSTESGRRVPFLLQRARAGDLAPFAQAAMGGSRGFQEAVRFGLLLAFTCSEDVWRIRPDEVVRETAGRFIGDWRVRGQMAACADWPRGEVPADYYRPFRSDVPVLLVSGNLDPVTPPSWGEVARNSLPNSIHLVLPGSHVPNHQCVERLAAQLFRTGSIEGLDPNCAADARNPPFFLPGASGRPH